MSNLTFPSRKPSNHKVKKGSAGKHVFTLSQNAQRVGFFGVSSLNRVRIADVATVSSVAGSSTPDHPLYHIASAILRYILQKYVGVVPQRLDTEFSYYMPSCILDGVYDTENTLRQIRFYQKTMDTAAGQQGRFTIAEAFVVDMASRASNFVNRAWHLAYKLQEYFCVDDAPTAGQPHQQMKELYGFDVQVQTAMLNGTTHRPRVESTIERLDDRKFTIMSNSYVKMFNHGRSVTAGGAESDLSLADQTHLKGKIWYFSDPYPVLDTPVVDALSTADQTVGRTKEVVTDSNGDGFIVPASTTSSISGFWTMPGGDVFTNAKYESSYAIRQGETRTIPLTFTFHGYLNKFLSRYSQLKLLADAGLQTYSPFHTNTDMGTCLLFAYEEQNKSHQTSGSAESMNVWWEVTRDCFVNMGPHKRYYPERYEMRGGLNNTGPELAIAADALHLNAIG